ncbi:MAG: hypothetical protein IT384_21015 [Deltaproteobacteria bacterium]|nr:hypothetical protein [Deltaproteobacteria bacterium]
MRAAHRIPRHLHVLGPALGLVAFARCVPTSAPSVIEAGPNEILVSAVLHRSTEEPSELRVSDAHLWAEGRGSLALAALEGDSVVVARLERSELRDPNGLALGDEVIAAARARVRGRAAIEAESDVDLGACGRCLASSPVAPATLFAGDLCPVPPFARLVRVSGEVDLTEATRALARDVLLAWPGACACFGAPDAPAVVPELRVVSPLPGARVYRSVTIDEHGSIAAITSEATRLFDRSGRALDEVTPVRTNLGSVRLLAPLPPDPGREAGFLLAYSGPEADLATYQTVTLIDGQARQAEFSGIREVLAGAVTPVDGELLILGSAEAGLARPLVARRCSVTGRDAVLSCVPEEPCPSRNCYVPQFHVAVTTPLGVWAIGEQHGLIRRSPTGEWTTTQVESSVGPIESLLLVQQAGDRIWFCGVVSDDPRHTFVLTASVGSSLPEHLLTRPILDLGPLRATTSTNCGSLWAAPNGEGVILEQRNSGGLSLLPLRLDGAVGALERLDALAVAAAARAPNGWLAITTPDGRVLRRAPGESTVTRLFGHPNAGSLQPSMLAEGDGGATVVDGEGRFLRARFSSSPVRSLDDVTLEPLGVQLQLEPELVAQALARDRGDQSLVRVVVLAPDLRLVLQRVDPTRGEVTPVAEGRLRGDFLGEIELLSPWPGTMLIAAPGATSPLLAWRAGDPAITAVDIGSSVPQRVTHGHGVVWVNGRDHLVRVRNGGDTFVAERIPLRTLPVEGVEDGSLGGAYAARPVCPDAVHLAGEVQTRGGYEAVLRLCLSADCAGLPSERAVPALVVDDRLRVHGFSRVVHLIGPHDFPMPLSAVGDLETLGGRRAQLPFYGPYTVLERDEAVFIGGQNGWLAIGVYRP